MSDFTCITQWGEDARRDRAMDSDEYIAWCRKMAEAPRREHCLACGAWIHTSNIDGGYWRFERDTTELHKCTYQPPRRRR